MDEGNADKALRAIWACLAEAEAASSGPRGRDGLDGSGVQEQRDEGVRGVIRIKTLELASLPERDAQSLPPALRAAAGGGVATGAGESDEGQGASGDHERDLRAPVGIDHLVIDQSALWSLALAYTFEAHLYHTRQPPVHSAGANSDPQNPPTSSANLDKRDNTDPTSSAHSSTHSPTFLSPFEHPYLRLLPSLSPRALTLRIPTLQRATYLRRRSYVPICCNRPECRAAMARIWAAPVVQRDVVRDMCDSFWVSPVGVNRQGQGEGHGAGDRPEKVVITGITDEQPPMLTFHHPAQVQADGRDENIDADKKLEQDADVAKQPGGYSICFTSCLCAHAAYADEYCPNHVSIRRRAMQVAAVLDGRLGVGGARAVARGKVDSLMALMGDKAEVQATGNAGEDGLHIAVADEGQAGVDGRDDSTGANDTMDVDQSTETAAKADRPAEAVLDEVMAPGDLHLRDETSELHLSDVSKVGWTFKSPEEVDLAIWRGVREMLDME